MIVNSNIATDNVIKYNNKLSTLVCEACRDIEQAAYKKQYKTYIVVDSNDDNMLNSVANFLYDKLGYRVIVNNDNVFLVSWYERVIKHVDCLMAEVAHLTAEQACRLADSVDKTYDEVCSKINECIMDSSNSGKCYCSYDTSDLTDSVVLEIRESLWSAGYRVEINDNRLMIKWGSMHVSMCTADVQS